MIFIRNFSFLLLILICTQCTQKKNTLFYPEITQEKVFDEFNNKKIVEDNYRNIENLNDSVVLNWLKSQKELSIKTINDINGKATLLNRLNSSPDPHSFSISKLKIIKDKGEFYLKKLTNDKHSKLYFRSKTNNIETLLFDPEKINNDYSINYIQPSWDGSKIVIGLTKNDEEFSELKILNVKTKKIMPNAIGHALPNALGGVEWLPDNNRFIFTYTPIINSKEADYLKNPKAIIYNSNTGVFTDILSKTLYPNYTIGSEELPIIYLTSPSNTYTLGAIVGASKYRDTYYAPTNNLTNKNIWKPLYSKDEKIGSFFIENDNLYYTTAKKASNFKICKVSLKAPDFNNPTILIEEDPNSVITDFTLTSQGLFYVKTKNGVMAKLYRFDESTLKSKEIPLPKSSGHINLQSNGYEYSDLWIKIEGWTSKRERYQYNFNLNKFKKANLNPVKNYPELDDVNVEEIEIPSHDGIMVPLSIIYKKSLTKDKNSRLLINAYGSYNWSNSPYLYPYLLHWVKEGGIYAVAHVRGGGEKGDAWHKGGFKTTKYNSWKDLIASTEYFIKNNYTTTDKIAVWGASAGGITIGRAITERPDLFSAAIIRVGFFNTMRLESDPISKFNIKEFGTIKDSIECKALLEMDAYHHIEEDVKYPAVYLTAGMNDARVPAWQPAKFAARLQEATASNKPVLLSVDFEGGHGFEASQNKKNEELADIMAFAFWQTGHPDYQPKK